MPCSDDVRPTKDEGSAHYHQQFCCSKTNWQLIKMILTSSYDATHRIVSRKMDVGSILAMMTVSIMRLWQRRVDLLTVYFSENSLLLRMLSSSSTGPREDDSGLTDGEGGRAHERVSRRWKIQSGTVKIRPYHRQVGD
ncbi:unnamed protein product [Protopolystoma xenopodis]|uniref:Uncharacterized protein n=1 Tax=Protopolystoma xenopodis TaxID=117903 RepID=A0A448WH98_9PLAT|nr:unnamed protein product [Protopolystoma xenopodis]